MAEPKVFFALNPQLRRTLFNFVDKTITEYETRIGWFSEANIKISKCWSPARSIEIDYDKFTSRRKHTSNFADGTAPHRQRKFVQTEGNRNTRECLIRKRELLCSTLNQT